MVIMKRDIPFWGFYLVGVVGYLCWKYDWQWMYKVGTGPFFTKRFGKEFTRKITLWGSIICFALGAAAQFGYVDLNKPLF
jgi:hypothetical protein